MAYVGAPRQSEALRRLKARRVGVSILGAPPPAEAAERLICPWAIGVAVVLIMMQNSVSLWGAAGYAAAAGRREYGVKMAEAPDGKI